MLDETPYKIQNRTPKTPFNIRLGRSIRNRRVSLGMSRKTLAAYCGRSVSQLARYERGEVSITMDILIKIALHTGVHVEFYLFAGRDEIHRIEEIRSVRNTIDYYKIETLGYGQLAHYS